jgi:hypothetical protein
VPSGHVLRPMTSRLRDGGPPTLDDPERLVRLFPGFALKPLDTWTNCAVRAEDNRLLYIAYADQSPAQSLPLILVDVPDFNTVEQANWDKADRMLDRAEVVVFVVFGDAYKDDRVVSELGRCCRKAGFWPIFSPRRRRPRRPPSGRICWRLSGVSKRSSNAATTAARCTNSWPAATRTPVR